MKLRKINFAVFGLFVSATSLLLSVPANAHVTVKPGEVQTASFQTFTVGAPNEKGVGFNKIELEIPAGFEHVTPALSTGWKIDVEKEGEGEDTIVKSITWSGLEVPSGFRQDFVFSAKAPAEATDLQWKAYQTYSDGTVVAWDLTNDQQPKKEDGSPDFSKSGPFSVTKVVSKTAAAESQEKTESAAADAKSAADRAMYFGAAGVVISLAAIYLASKKKS